MEYNTQTPIRLKEYGRNIQNMANQLFNIEDRTERNQAARQIIHVMSNMSSNQREGKDFKQKLWDHLAFITEYKLDIDYPFEVRMQSELQKDLHLPYSQGRVMYLHYGKIIQDLIQKAISLEDGEVKEALIIQIANHMKKSHTSWNKNTVTDRVILEDLKELSDGKLDINDEMKLTKKINYNNGASNNNGKRNNNGQNRKRISNRRR